MATKKKSASRSTTSSTAKAKSSADKNGKLGYVDISKLTNLPDPLSNADPAWVETLCGARPGHDSRHTLSSIREREYRGRQIRIETTYQITINGKPFHGHCVVKNDGTLYTHSCPYREFDSAVDMMQHLIDLYPESFEQRGLEKEAPAMEGRTEHLHHPQGHEH